MRVATHRTAVRRDPQIARPVTFPAPAKGLVTNTNLAMQEKGTARRLDNYFPTTRGIRPRLGTVKYATIDSGGDPVYSVFSYDAGATKKLFAASGTDVYDITTVADPDVVPSAAISSLTDGDFSTQQFATSAGHYLYALNNADNPQIFDGSTWQEVTGASSPVAITGVTPALLSAVWSHGKRLWFIEEGTLSAWYLAVDSIGGSATEFIFSGIFRKGGALLFGTTWSLDTGEGMDDKCIFVTTNGEVAVYSGTDPSSPSTWSLDGVFELAEPMGKSAFFHKGGVPHILTADGVMPMDVIPQVDPSEININSMSFPIDNLWRAEALTRNTLSWKAIKWVERNMLIFPTPKGSDLDDTQYFVSNLETKAWAKWINWDLTSGAIHSGLCYAGTADGIVYQIEVGGQDDEATYTCTCVFNFDHLGAPEVSKVMRMGRVTSIGTNDVSVKVSCSSNYTISLPAAPSSIAAFSSDVWDSGLWDTAIWSVGIEDPIPYTTRWQSVGKEGYAHAPQIQQTFGISSTHYNEIVSLAAIFEMGSLVN